MSGVDALRPGAITLAPDPPGNEEPAPQDEPPLATVRADELERPEIARRTAYFWKIATMLSYALIGIAAFFCYIAITWRPIDEHVAVLGMAPAPSMLGSVPAEQRSGIAVTWRDAVGSKALTPVTGFATPLRALDRPNLLNRAVVKWATSAAVAIQTISFDRIDERLTYMRRFFTDDGWISFTEAFEGSNAAQLLRSNEQIITAAPVDASTLISVGETLEGIPFWEVQVPLRRAIQSTAKTVGNATILATMLIVYVPQSLEHPNGFAIQKYVEGSGLGQ